MKDFLRIVFSTDHICRICTFHTSDSRKFLHRFHIILRQSHCTDNLEIHKF